MSYVHNLVYNDAEDLAGAAAHHIATVLNDAVRDRATASLCLAGGTTPRAAYETLAAQHRGDVDWPNVHVWFGDERCVSPEDEQSNFRVAELALLSQVPIPLSNVHRVLGELKPAAAARTYDTELHSAFPDVMTEPSFDLLLLGMGTDGHVASLFPDSAALREESQWAVAEFAPQTEPRVPRVTLTPPILRRARKVLFLVAGAAKRDATRRVLLEGEELPAAMIHGREQTLWLMDVAASPAG
jgi:6-phosphogluconolactonase